MVFLPGENGCGPLPVEQMLLVRQRPAIGNRLKTPWMICDPRYDILFEPMRIGQITAKNRFYQVSHCCGMGFNWPQNHAKMGETKAGGG